VVEEGALGLGTQLTKWASAACQVAFVEVLRKDLDSGKAFLHRLLTDKTEQFISRCYFDLEAEAAFW
jgi:hypothetical protein